ncbi:acyl-CoA thioesterase [Halobacteriales archaeon QS_3_64_16]|nr:MAG: acyl-CoA thioesterase [Halobacteriales archaeon QS_3_64_16]
MSADTYTYTIDVRFRDLDPRSHANHAVYISYCEQAKAALFEEVLTVSLADAPTVVRSLDIEYERAVTLGDRIEVAIGVGHLGRTSYALEYDLGVEDERVATARTMSVRLDSEGTPEPLPDSWRERLGPYHDEA